MALCKVTHELCLFVLFACESGAVFFFFYWGKETENLFHSILGKGSWKLRPKENERSV